MKVKERPAVCSPLSTVEGKFHLVLNLKYLDQFLHVLSFKYADLCTTALLFEQGEYLFKFTFKSECHHVDIWPGHRQFIGFCRGPNGSEIIMYLKFYHLGCLPPATFLLS